MSMPPAISGLSPDRVVTRQRSNSVCGEPANLHTSKWKFVRNLWFNLNYAQNRRVGGLIA
jgi:hypothetical protein